jgi:hypothetical protein
MAKVVVGGEWTLNLVVRPFAIAFEGELQNRLDLGALYSKT